MDDTADFPVADEAVPRSDMPHTAEFQLPPEPDPAPRSPRRQRPSDDTVWLWAAPVLVLGLVVLLIWTLQLHARLPAIHLGGAQTDRLGQGPHPIDSSVIQRSGDWYTQSYGTDRELVSETGGSSLSFTFYGTSLSLTALVGPESGRLYVQVDDNPVDGLRSDERGSYLSLLANQAQDRSIAVISGLSAQEHHARLTVGGNGTVALSMVTVASEPAFPWALTLLEVTVFGALAATLIAVGRQLGGETRRARADQLPRTTHD